MTSPATDPRCGSPNHPTCFGCGTALTPSRIRMGLLAAKCQLCGLRMVTSLRQEGRKR
jgi:hypothetical protein